MDGQQAAPIEYPNDLTLKQAKGIMNDTSPRKVCDVINRLCEEHGHTLPDRYDES